MSNAGRPTKYKKEYCTQVEKLCKLGATDKEIADFFEVALSTIGEWKNEFPEFSDSIKKGKILADSNIAERLYQRAFGFKHPEIKHFVVKKSRDMEEIQERKVTKVYPPDTVAAIFWLKNRAPKTWRDKQEIGVDLPEGFTVTLNLGHDETKGK